MDYETRALDQDHDALRLWLRLLTCSKLIEGEVRRALHAEFDCTLPRFDLLAQLYREPAGLGMGALSKRMMVTGGNVTGIADQLEKDGFLVRSAAPDDRRQVQIQLTAKGKREFARMASVHERWIIELFAGISDAERSRLHDLLGALKTSMLEKTG
jgi:DNA-binding MarR family transcriptional regulator